MRNCEYFELFVPEKAFLFPLAGALPINAQGIAHVPQGPGLGVEIDWPEVDRLCVSHRTTAL